MSEKGVDLSQMEGHQMRRRALIEVKTAPDDLI